MKHYTNAQVFTGREWISNGTVSVENGKIIGIHNDNVSGEIIDCQHQLLLPALIDLQLYGAGGKLFSAYPEPESLRVLAEENRKSGTALCLATIATQPLPVIYECLEALKSYRKAGGKGILGMHLEGPFMNVAKRGAHKAEWLHAPSVDEVKALLDAADGVIKIVTIAPEICEDAVIQLFLEAGVFVSAGHSNATYEQASQFSKRGVQLVTHLFNAMSPLHHRDTGLPGVSFQDENLVASIIPDGIHVSYSALAIAKRQMGERLFLITDSVTECHTGPYQHQLNGDHYCTADGTLSGSAISLLEGVKNAMQFAGIDRDESIRMASLYPAKAIGISNDFGSISIGKKADMILVNEQLELVANFIE